MLNVPDLEWSDSDDSFIVVLWNLFQFLSVKLQNTVLVYNQAKEHSACWTLLSWYRLEIVECARVPEKTQ